MTSATYDRRGRLLGWGDHTFTWDTLGRMTSMQGPGINRSMFYDAGGERIVVRDGSTFTFTLREVGQQVLREVSWSAASGWRWGKDYVYREGVLLASHSTSDGLRYHFPDHLTSPRLVANRCGERVLEHRTSSFGLDLPSGSSQSPDRMRFTMHERDLGLLDRTWDDFDYMHARTYTPYLGRFVSVDPGRDNDPKVPQSWNLYAYVRNNPLARVDPNGRSAKKAIQAALANPRLQALATAGASVLADYASRELPPGPARGLVLTGATVLAVDSAVLSAGLSAGSFVAAFGTVETGVGPIAGSVTGVGFAALCAFDIALAAQYAHRAYHNLLYRTDPLDTAATKPSSEPGVPDADEGAQHGHQGKVSPQPLGENEETERDEEEGIPFTDRRPRT